MKLKFFEILKINFLRQNILFITPFIILIFFNITEHNDSISYIDNYPRRPFLYPSIIDLFQFISENYFKVYLKIFQLSFGFFAIIFFLDYLKKKIYPNKILEIIFFLILLFPYINLSMPLGNSILSESIAYPLFLFFLVFCFNFVLNDFYEVNFLKLLLIVVLLIVTRSQFYFLIPLIFFLLLIKSINEKKFLLKSLIYLAIAYFLISILQLSYNKIKFSKFSSVNIASFQFVALSHFISSDHNFSNLKNPIHLKIINNVNDYLIKNHDYKIKKKSNIVDTSQNKLLSKIKNLRSNYNNYYHFYVPIIHAYEYELPKNILIKNNEIENLNELNKEVFWLAIELIKQSPQDYLVLYLSNVIFGLGGYFVEAENFKGLMMNVGFSGSYLFILQILIVIFFSIKIIFKKKIYDDEVYLYFSVFLNLVNVCFVCFFEPPYDRYIFYTNIIFLIFLLNKIFNRKIDIL